MYQAPDLIKVDINVSDSFAAYGAACPMDDETTVRWTAPCSPADPNYSYTYKTYVADNPGAEWQCYSQEFAPM